MLNQLKIFKGNWEESKYRARYVQKSGLLGGKIKRYLSNLENILKHEFRVLMMTLMINKKPFSTGF